LWSRSINHYQDGWKTCSNGNIGIEKYFSYIVLKSPIVKERSTFEDSAR